MLLVSLVCYTISQHVLKQRKVLEKTCVSCEITSYSWKYYVFRSRSHAVILTWCWNLNLMFSPPLNASTCNHLLIAPSLLFSLRSVQCVYIYSSCVFATVSAQQSFVSSHRLFIMQLRKDDPGTLLLAQSHPGNWLTEMHQLGFFILRGEKFILNLVSEFDQTCVNGATSHLVMSFKNSQELAEMWENERSNPDQPCQAHSVVLLTCDAVHINTYPAILANYTEGPS